MTPVVWATRRAEALRNGALSPGEVQVWAIHLGSREDDSATLRLLLSDDERERARAYGSPARRRQFVVCRAFLRFVLAGYLGIRPTEVRLRVGPKGKPELAIPQDRRIRFNLSHCADLAVLGVADQPIGVDVETVLPSPDFDGVARRHFHPAERRVLAALPTAERRPAFFRCWTCKEAVLKALGTGFGTPMSSFAVTFADGAQPRLVEHDHRFTSRASWHLSQLKPLPGVVGAVAVPGPVVAVRGTVVVGPIS